MSTVERMNPPGELSHFDDRGEARMVDVGGKPDTERTATARGEVHLSAEAAAAIAAGTSGKGDVLGVARLAGIMAAKRTAELIPLCHPLPLTSVAVSFELDRPSRVLHVEATVQTVGKTGVEMEALTAVSVASLTVYDMLKSIDKSLSIHNVRLVRKTGGKSGAFERPSA